MKERHYILFFIIMFGIVGILAGSLWPLFIVGGVFLFTIGLVIISSLEWQIIFSSFLLLIPWILNKLTDYPKNQMTLLMTIGIINLICVILFLFHASKGTSWKESYEQIHEEMIDSYSSIFTDMQLSRKIDPKGFYSEIQVKEIPLYQKIFNKVIRNVFHDKLPIRESDLTLEIKRKICHEVERYKRYYNDSTNESFYLEPAYIITMIHQILKITPTQRNTETWVSELLSSPLRLNASQKIWNDIRDSYNDIVDKMYRGGQ